MFALPLCYYLPIYRYAYIGLVVLSLLLPFIFTLSVYFCMVSVVYVRPHARIRGGQRILYRAGQRTLTNAYVFCICLQYMLLYLSILAIVDIAFVGALRGARSLSENGLNSRALSGTKRTVVYRVYAL